MVVSKAPQKQKAAAPPPALGGPGSTAPQLTAPGEQLKGAVDVRGIVAANAAAAKPAPPKQEESLGSDFSDEEEVPPLA